MPIQPFGPIEKAVKELLVELYEPAQGKVGGDLSYEPGADLYIFIGLVPGSGSTDQIEGEWAVDIDVFGPTYSTADKTGAMDHALALEALLLSGPGFRTSTMKVDKVYQNVAPSERPWGDDSAFRIGATYVFTARRSG